MSVRVASYVHIRRSRTDVNPTGVGKHIQQMVPGLARQPGFAVSLLGAREDLDGGQMPAASTLRGLPLATFGWPRKYVEAAWALFAWPAAERWTGRVDWVYCPMDAYVPRRRARLATTIHCVNWFDPELPWYNAPPVVQARRGMGPRFRRCQRDADLVFPVSEFLKGKLVELFNYDPAKMVVVGNGTEEAYFQPGELPDELRKIADAGPYVVVVGGLNPRKGADATLAVARELSGRKADLRVLVAGDSEAGYRDRAADIPNLVQLGYVGVDNGLPALLKHSVALFFPSRYETFGIPAVEAMAAGTPAVVSHYAALPEVVGDAGLVIDPTDARATAEALLQLRDDPTRRERLIAAGRQRAGHFRWERCVERVAAALRDAR